MKFFVGIHHPDKAHKLAACCISINALLKRCSPFAVNDWILDSGAFTTIAKHGGYPEAPEVYASQIANWADCGYGNLEAAVSQDFMCEPQMLERTGLSIAEHQRLTIERYGRIAGSIWLQSRRRPVYVMPVLQGYQVDDYVRHVRAYGLLLKRGMWVGVGSVCKRNRNPREVQAVLEAIKRVRPDLRLHGFGVKVTALKSPAIQGLLHSADSMAWSFAARKQGRDANSWQEAKAWAERIEASKNRAAAA